MSNPVDIEDKGAQGGAGAGSFWAKHRDDIILGLLIVYVVLLGIGTVAELLDIRSILNWPIYR